MAPYAIRLGDGSSEVAENTGTLAYVGAVPATCSTRPIAVSGAGRLSGNGSSALEWEGIKPLDADATIVLSGTASGCVARNVCDKDESAISVVKEGAGGWNVDGNMKITGGVECRGGSLRVLNSKKYKFYNSATGNEEFSTKYNFAYTLGANGYAFVKDTGGICCMIDASGKVVHKPPTDNVYHYPISGVNQGYYARRYYEIPYVSDISAIGCERVDENGWIRVRIRLIGRSSAVYNQVIADYEALVNISGEFFDIPSGYTIEAYSDGVLLLSKDGRYGYYSTEGKWIAQPIFTYAEPFIQGLAVVGHETGTRGMIDTQGNIVLPFVFSHISNVSSAIVTAYSEVGGWETFRLVSKNDAEQVQNP